MRDLKMFYDLSGNVMGSSYVIPEVFVDWRLTSVSDNKNYSYVSPTLPNFKQVIFHNPATIIYWEDGSKTVAKCGKGDVFDKEKGVMVALLKKLYGSKQLNSMLSSVAGCVKRRKG